MARRVLLDSFDLERQLCSVRDEMNESLQCLLVVGIDTGLQGGIAFMPIRCATDAFVIPMPVVQNLGARKSSKKKTGGKKDYDDQSICSIFGRLRGHTSQMLVGIEQTQPQGGGSHGRRDSAMTAYSMGSGFRMWILFFHYLGVSIERIRPQQWKKEFGLIGMGKEASFRKARELWPGMAQYFALKADEGRAEAMLIAEATRRIRRIQL